MIETKNTLEEKRKIILGIIQILYPYWNLAKDVYLAVSDVDVDEAFIDEIANIIERATIEVRDEQSKSNMKNAFKSLKLLRIKEENEMNSQNNDINTNLF